MHTPTHMDKTSLSYPLYQVPSSKYFSHLQTQDYKNTNTKPTTYSPHPYFFSSLSDFLSPSRTISISLALKLHATPSLYTTHHPHLSLFPTRVTSLCWRLKIDSDFYSFRPHTSSSSRKHGQATTFLTHLNCYSTHKSHTQISLKKILLKIKVFKGVSICNRLFGFCLKSWVKNPCFLFSSLVFLLARLPSQPHCEDSKLSTLSL